MVDTAEISDNRLSEIIIAAVGAAGPQRVDEDTSEWEERVASSAKSIYLLTDSRSTPARRVLQVANSKKFVATLTKVTKEQTSGRAVVTLVSDRVSKFNKTGIEYARTEFLDSQEGLEMAKLAGALRGHRVRVYIELVEKANGDGEKVRMLRHLIDLGEAKDSEER